MIQLKSGIGLILAGIIVTIILCVAINYYIIVSGQMSTSSSHKHGDLYSNLSESLYFTTTTLSSVGYGDIAPRQNSLKFWSPWNISL